MDQLPKPDKQRTYRIVGMVLSLGLLGVIVLMQDWKELLRLAAGIPISVFISGIALIVLRVIVFALRWLALMHAQKIQLGILETLRLQWAGLYAGNFLPTSVGGDVVRLYGVLPSSPRKMVAVASIAMDRSLGAIGMLFFLPFSFPILSSFLAGTVAGIAEGQHGLSKRLRVAIEQFFQVLSLWTSKPLSLLTALMASLIGIFSFLIMIYLLALALEIPIDFMGVAGASALTYYIALVPFSINAYGVRELGVVFVYTQIGATSEQALALALLSRALFLLVSLPGALLLPQVLVSRQSDIELSLDE